MPRIRRWAGAVAAALCVSCGAAPAPADAVDWPEASSARGAVALDLPPGFVPGLSFRLETPAGEGLRFVDSDTGNTGSVYVTRALVVEAERANPDTIFARILSYVWDRLERGPREADCESLRVGPVEGGEFYGRLAVWSCPDDSAYAETIAVSGDRTVAVRLIVSYPESTDGDVLIERILRSVVIDRDAVPLEVQAGGAVFGR